MESAIQKIAAICFLIIGLSHIFQPRVWAEFFILFRSKGEAGSFLTALLHLPIGALIVAFHNVWHGMPIVLTLIGWGYILKSLIYFTFPKHGLRMLSRVTIERSWEFIIPGVLIAGYGGLLAFSLLNN
jgi:hypothetical protein